MSDLVELIKKSSDVPVDPDLGEGYYGIITELKNRYAKESCERNKYLDNIPEITRFNAQHILEKKIIDIEYEIKINNIKLKQLREKRNLFNYYADYTSDPY